MSAQQVSISPVVNWGNVSKKLLVKIFAGPIWEGKLVEFVGVFTKRKDEFQLALTIHVTVGVDEANLQLDTVHELTTDVSQKYVAPSYTLSVHELTTCVRIDVLLQLFKEFVTPQQKELAATVEKMGGDAALNDQQAMEELARVEYKLTVHSGCRKDCVGTFNFAELRQEIMDSPDRAIRKNSEFFSGKFEIQKREIQDVVHREGDRIISAMIAGPHDRIIDPVRCTAPHLCVVHGSPFTLGGLPHMEGDGA